MRSCLDSNPQIWKALFLRQLLCNCSSAFCTCWPQPEWAKRRVIVAICSVYEEFKRVFERCREWSFGAWHCEQETKSFKFFNTKLIDPVSNFCALQFSSVVSVLKTRSKRRFQSLLKNNCSTPYTCSKGISNAQSILTKLYLYYSSWLTLPIQPRVSQQIESFIVFATVSGVGPDAGIHENLL